VLFAAFKSLGQQFLVISGLVLVCALVAWLFDGRQAAIGLIDTAVVGMKGPWVWTFGFGLASFVSQRGRRLPLDINGVLAPNEVTAALTGRIERSTRHRNAYPYTIPITLLGLFLTSAYGIPSTGFAYYANFAGICAIYYIAGFLLFHFVEVILAFHQLFESMETVEFKRLYSPLHLENLTSYLAMTTALGLIAIYAGFRGTLTAGFHFHHEVWRIFLSTPLILFLPGTLFYNYYPRYVLRKILQYKVFRTMERLGVSDESSTKGLLLDLRESAVLSSQILPFLDYKSLPSYLLAIFFAISLAYNSDPAVKTFFNYLLGVSSQSTSP
jgi:hypothetical protein